MTGTAAPRQQLEERLASTAIHRTPCGEGKLQWQHWSGPDAGPTLLLVHGGFGSWNHWFANTETLRRRRNLWSLDLPGLGDSADIPHSATPADFAALLMQGIDMLWPDEQPFELAGFSFGAMVGARLAEMAGERCGRFTAIGAAGFGELHVQVPLQAPPSPATPWEQAAPVHRENLRTLMFSGTAAIDDLAVYLHAHNLARHRFNSRALSLTDDFLRALPAIGSRLHAVWGSADATAGGAEALAARGEQLREAGAGFEILEGVGHWAMYEAAAAINDILLRD